MSHAPPPSPSKPKISIPPAPEVDKDTEHIEKIFSACCCDGDDIKEEPECIELPSVSELKEMAENPISPVAIRSGLSIVSWIFKSMSFCKKRKDVLEKK